MTNTKKLITLISLTLAGASAFAISDAQKADFISLIQSDVKTGAQFVQTVEAVAKSDLAKSVATWAESEPLAFNEWIISNPSVKKSDNAIIWVVRNALGKKRYEAYSECDAIIDDYRSSFDLALESKSDYNRLKESGFKLYGKKMSEWKIFSLTVKGYSDFDTAFANLKEVYIAEHFDVLLKKIPQAKLGSKQAYELYSKLSRDFAQYKDTIKAVGDNWERLQADKNEAFMAYYADQKLENLNK